MTSTNNNQIMQYFSYSHLPAHLQAISKPFCDTANWVNDNLPDSAEKSVCLRKLLEAKDAGVRAALPAPEENPDSVNSALQGDVVTAELPVEEAVEAPQPIGQDAEPVTPALEDAAPVPIEAPTEPRVE